MICILEDCSETATSRQMCSKHYTRWRRHKSPNIVKNRHQFKMGDDPTRHLPIAHGHVLNGHRTPTYQSWAAMLQRCSNPKRVNYKYYGGRGVTVCDRWLNSFANFLEDMGLRPEGHTLDRIDNAGNYEPTNCRWATYKEQARGRRKLNEVKHG